MEFLNKFKKGQSLPLNTIVIAILVIIVLLVIIVFFTSQVGQTGDQLEENSASACSPSNPALKALGYTHDNDFKPINVGNPDGAEKCDETTWTSAIGVKNCCLIKDSSQKGAN